MPIVDVSGNPAAGAGDLLPTDPIVQKILSGTASGVGTTTASAGTIYLFSAITGGSGTLSDDPLDLVPVLDPADGSGTTTALQVVVQKILSAQFSGSGTVTISEPAPIHGMGDTSSSVVVSTLRPVFPRTWCGTPKFTWGQTLTSGDLPLYLVDTSGNPYAPYLVSYTVFWIRPGGYAQQVGPANRTPIMADIGVFYATGVTGEGGGQPGLWKIIWRWQSNARGPFECYSYEFRVLDAAMTNDPRDQTPRVKKYGWGPA